MSGTVAIRMPASDELIHCSPIAISENGMTSSATANAVTAVLCANAFCREPRRHAIGTSTTAGQRDPPPCDAHGREILQSQLDEEVRQTPDRAQGRERRPGAPRHRRGTLSQELCGSTAIEFCDVARPHGGAIRHENLTSVLFRSTVRALTACSDGSGADQPPQSNPSQSNVVPTRAPGGAAALPDFTALVEQYGKAVVNVEVIQRRDRQTGQAG